METRDGLERWRGKTALVTGASSGIGAAVARGLAEAGINLVLAARRMERLEALAQELGANGVRVLPLVCDIGREADILALFAKTRQDGGIQILINNAGLTVREPVAAGTAQGWQAILDVNVLGLGYCMREALGQFADPAQAAIINISSVSAYIATVGRGSGMYTASKHAVRALTETLRMELATEGSQIKLGMVSPGIVDTEILTNVTGLDQLHLAAQPGSLQARDVADAVLYMLSRPQHVQINEIVLRPVSQVV